MYISILGRQPALGVAELEALYSDVSWLSDTAALIRTPEVDISRLGGSQKIGRVVAEFPRGDWMQISRKLVSAYADAWKDQTNKITLGISAYGFNVHQRDVQKTGIILKSKLKQSGVSLRLIPNDEPALSTATSHHNKLGLSENKVELIVVRANNNRVLIAESTGSQNITAYAKRDQGRPKRDAFVGMLPPKLAQMIVNLASNDTDNTTPTVLLDPFCGTGVVLQEAALMGYHVYGTDLSDKMIDYSEQNLEWLRKIQATPVVDKLEQGDAMSHKWQTPIDIVACESYLGQPFSAPPSPTKLREVRGNCNHIISTFLTNIGRQLAPGVRLCVAVPAWRDTSGNFTHLPLIDQLAALGYERAPFTSITPDQLLYYREDQVVARELLVLIKK